MPDDGKLIYGGWLISDWGGSKGPCVIEGGALYEKDGRIRTVGTLEALRKQYPGAQTIGDPDAIVIPGLVNAHSHGRGFSTYQMGQPDEQLELRVIEFATRAEWGANDVAGEANRGYDPYLDTMYSCLKQIASGITSTLHSQIYIDGPVETYADPTREVVKAYRDSGIRCAFALGVRDRFTYTFMDDEEFLSMLPDNIRSSSALRPVSCDMGFSEYYDLLKAFADEFPEVEFQLSPWNPVWCSDELMQQLTEASQRDGWRIHTHLQETRYQAEFGRKICGKSWVSHLNEIGMLSERFSGAHGIWVDRDDIETIKQCGAQIVYNPSSNMRLSSGFSPVRDYLNAGVTLGFGLDSLGMNDDDDMFQDLRLGQTIQNRADVDEQPISAGTMFDMATRGGATITGIEGIGSLSEGNWADVVLLSRSDIEGGMANQPLEDVILRRAKAAHVRTVIIGGKTYIQDGRWVGSSLEAVRDELSASAGTAKPRSSRAVQVVKDVVRNHLRGYD